MKIVLVNQAMAEGMDEVFGPRDDIEVRVVEEQTESALLRHIPGVHGLVLGLAPMTERVIETARGTLRVVARRGVGYDNVDVAALTRAGIPLTVVGTANSVSVAEHALHLMLALAKQSHVQDARLRTATWNDARLVRPVDLAGRRVLVLGLGRIGRLLVTRLLAMEMEVLVHDPFVAETEIVATGATAAADWRAALPQIDFLTVNCPKTPETTGMVGAPELAAMKRHRLRGQHRARRHNRRGGAVRGVARPRHRRAPASMHSTRNRQPPDNPLFDAGQRHLHPACSRVDHRGRLPDERARRPERGRRMRRRARPRVRGEPRSSRNPGIDRADRKAG